jgi:hypothetical protein
MMPTIWIDRDVRAARARTAEPKRTLKAFQDSQRVAPAVPTPERLLKAGEDYRIEEAISVEEVIGEDGRPKVEEIVRKRIRLNDSPLQRLAARGLLAPGDWPRNKALFEAGERYAELYKDGTPTLGAMDPSKPFISDSRVPAFFQNEWQLTQWQAYGAAAKKIWPVKHQIVVDYVVVEDGELETIMRRVSELTNVKKGVAVALHCLKEGLADLALHFGYIGAKDR